MMMGTLAVAGGAYFKKEIHKFTLFKKYETEVNHYVRWKINKQIVQYLNK